MDITAVVDLLTTIALIAGLVFAGVEWHASRREQRRQSQIQLLRSFDSPHFVRAMRTVLYLPEDQTQEEVVEQFGAETADLVWYWLGVMESLGVLTFHRAIDIRDVDQTLGGPIIISLRRLRRYIEGVRADSRDTMHEWFQWLGERLAELERDEGRTPAHLRETDWRP